MNYLVKSEFKMILNSFENLVDLNLHSLKVIILNEGSLGLLVPIAFLANTLNE